MKIFNEKTIIGRIRDLRIKHSGPRGKSNFARALGISPSTYSYYENNRIPPIETLLQICEITGADIKWLLTGQQEAEKLSGGQSDAVSNPVLRKKLSALLDKYPETAEAVWAFIELLYEKKGLEKDSYMALARHESERQGWIPVLGRTAAGIVHCWNQQSIPKPDQAVTELDKSVKKHIGKPIINSSDGKISLDLQIRPLIDSAEKAQANLIRVHSEEAEEIVEFVECEQVCGIFPDSFALHIDGDSMSPRINDGDVVILSPSVTAAQGHIAIAKIANQIGVTCKLIRISDENVHLIPINEKYESKVVPKDELLWALAVLCHITL